MSARYEWFRCQSKSFNRGTRITGPWVLGGQVIRSRAMATDAVSTVRAWHEALNAGSVEALIALSSDEIEVGGPRGRGTGPAAQLLREWFERAGIRLVPYQTFHRDSTVVVEQGASWRGPDAGITTEPQTVASVFIVKDGRAPAVDFAQRRQATASGRLGPDGAMTAPAPER
jgi:SnoaL-like domain